MSTGLSADSLPAFSARAFATLKALLRHPRQVATVFPSSVRLLERLSNRACVREASTIVELGPGAGGTSAALLGQMRCDAKLLAIEKTPAFARSLSSISDSRFTHQIGDAAELSAIAARQSITQCDVIVSGIPFSMLQPVVAETIIRQVHGLLADTGVFLAYQMKQDIRGYADSFFGDPSTEVVTKNLPPLTIFSWTKIDDSTSDR